jgi:UDP-N-acetylglucosamine acyltransferase
MTAIHPTAIVDPKAQLAADVEIGPNCVIEAGVTIGARTKIGPMVHIQGTTVIGEDNQIYTGATIGFPPQYLGFDGSATKTVIGNRNVIREYGNIHRALNDASVTSIGDDNFFMAFAHVAHDCHVGNRVILANGALLAGHVTVGDRAFISGNAVVHQFCRIGRMAMLGGLCGALKDIPPFCTALGAPATLRKLNLVGLRRAGVSAATCMELRRLYREIHLSEKLLSEVVRSIDVTTLSPEGREFVEFYRTSKRGVTPANMKRNRAAVADDDDSAD